MSFLSKSTSTTVKLPLVRDRTRQIQQGYPWLYRDCFGELPKAEMGSKAMIRDRDGSLIAFGMYDPDGPLTARILAVRDERLDDNLVQERLDRALNLRRQIISPDTSGYRLINGEGDLLPGLVCDIYSDCAVIKPDGPGPTAFWDLQGVAEWLQTTLDIITVYHKARAGGALPGRTILGPEICAPILFKEHGATFEVDVVNGQKTGFFLDQRENRHQIRKLASGASMLNICGYTGGFSIAAGLGGAKDVTTVDIAKPALAAAERNWSHNNLNGVKHDLIAQDAFEFLANAKHTNKRWSLIVVDPPSFASASKLVERAKESYIALFSAALAVADGDALVALSSCSSHISQHEFIELCEMAVSKARRRATVISVSGQPADHPFPLVCRELQYLKFVLLSVR